MPIDLKGKSNVYQQIVEHYKRYIMLGIIKPMEKLPSCRALAKELGINPNTVERAYSELEKEKLIVTIAKKGVYALASDEDDSLGQIKKMLEDIKQLNISKEKLLEIIDEVYRKEEINND